MHRVLWSPLESERQTAVTLMLCIDFVSDSFRLPVDICLILIAACLPDLWCFFFRVFPSFPTAGHEAVATDGSVGSSFGVGVFPC